jgi:hypothetical protein
LPSALRRAAPRVFEFSEKYTGAVQQALLPKTAMSVKQPLFVHVHVPKTAGTSLNLLLQSWFKERHHTLYATSPTHVYTEAELHDWVDKHPEILSLASHSIRIFPPFLAGRPVVYYCFLRHPVDWMISNFTYAKKNLRNFKEEHRKNWPEQIETMTFREYYQFRLEQRKTQPTTPKPGALGGSPLNQFFSAETFKKNQSFLQPERPDKSGNIAPHFQSICVAMTTTILESFSMVGLLERFDDSAEMLRRLIVSFGIPAEPMPMPRANVSSELRGDLSWINDQDEVGKAILQAVKRDMIVFDYGKALFQKKFEAMKASEPVPTTPMATTAQAAG